MPVVRLAVHVRPGGSRTEVGGSHGGAVAVRVTAAPEAGRANRAVVEAVAEALGVPRRTVAITAGATSRRKVVAVEVDTASDGAAVLARWHDLAGAD